MRMIALEGRLRTERRGLVQLLGVGALTAHKVKGHGDCKWNDLADRLATLGRAGGTPEDVPDGVIDAALPTTPRLQRS